MTPASHPSAAAAAAENVIQVRNLRKRYGKVAIHKGIDLDVRRGEVLSIVGSSGSGKTTFLRQLAALEKPTGGRIQIFGENMRKLSARGMLCLRRRCGMAFQHGALFSALTTLENVALPLRELRSLPGELVRETALRKLEMVGLSVADADKMPSDLSGGMIKRAALARALALEPELVFLDEPTAGLDPQGSDDYVALIAALRRELNLTVVMVTHDLDTLVALSDRVAVLADGRLLAAAPIPQLLHIDHPFVREYFLGARGRRAIAALEEGS
ncbi:MAG: ATP-binding cassette domain-containing protein, partial [Candidatus Protistobacter heckmanni]|nr:ATP-binding cassette domain-containing protein [Candidatus Protistobacter heckmanni]